MEDRSKGQAGAGAGIVSMNLDDPQFKNLHPVVQEILQTVKKSAQTNRMAPEKFGRLTFSEHP